MLFFFSGASTGKIAFRKTRISLLGPDLRPASISVELNVQSCCHYGIYLIYFVRDPQTVLANTRSAFVEGAGSGVLLE